MKRIALFAVVPLMIAAPAASAQDGSRSGRIEIDLANFKYTPDRIVLHHGQAYVFHFVNQASGGHNFAAKAFFGAAAIDPADRAKLEKGTIELGGGETLDVRLTAPAEPAVYDVRCTHFMHQTFGMKGQIVVE